MQELYDLFFGGFFIEVGADPDILVELPEGAVAMGADPANQVIFYIFTFLFTFCICLVVFYSCPTCPPGDSAGPRCTPPSTPGSPPDIFNGFIDFQRFHSLPLKMLHM